MSAYQLHPHFILRRLHSLFGLLPVGAFLLFHLWENSQSRFGAEHYNQAVVGALQRMNYLPLLEIFAIALPLLFHAGYGLLILKGGNPDLKRYPWLHNRFFWLQRLSGAGILLFLLFHLAMTRFQSLLDPSLKTGLFEHMQQILSQPSGFLLYLLGLALSVFHLGNGLWSMGISWGVTVTPEAQQRSFILCMGLSLLLFAMGLHGLWGFVA